MGHARREEREKKKKVKVTQIVTDRVKRMSGGGGGGGVKCITGNLVRCKVAFCVDEGEEKPPANLQVSKVSEGAIACVDGPTECSVKMKANAERWAP